MKQICFPKAMSHAQLQILIASFALAVGTGCKETAPESSSTRNYPLSSEPSTSEAPAKNETKPFELNYQPDPALWTVEHSPAGRRSVALTGMLSEIGHSVTGANAPKSASEVSLLFQQVQSGLHQLVGMDLNQKERSEVRDYLQISVDSFDQQLRSHLQSQPVETSGPIMVQLALLQESIMQL